ncbi:MAG: ArsI/CadI family heavy metal resistance metalloenzyme [Alphaproteobacteria bacterium]
MKRLHVSIAVEDFAKSVGFYTTLFGGGPTTERPGYAKWFLDDPRVNFVVHKAAADGGVNHLGLQVESPAELVEVADRLKAAEELLQEQTAAQCCYHVSDKAWSRDPQGISWETFYTTGEITHAGDDRNQLDAAPSSGGTVVCCGGARTASA